MTDISIMSIELLWGSCTPRRVTYMLPCATVYPLKSKITFILLAVKVLNKHLKIYRPLSRRCYRPLTRRWQENEKLPNVSVIQATINFIIYQWNSITSPMNTYANILRKYRTFHIKTFYQTLGYCILENTRRCFNAVSTSKRRQLSIIIISTCVAL